MTTHAMADRPSTTVEIEIDAVPEVVWPYVVDIVTPVEGSAELQQVEWLDGVTVPALGARFTGHNARGDSAWTTTSTIVELEEPVRFTWAVESVEEPVATWGFELHPTASGGTLLRQRVSLGPGRSGLTWAIRQNPESEHEIITGRLATLAKSMRRNLDLIAARATAA